MKLLKCGFVKILSVDCFSVVRSLKEVRENTYFSQGSQGKVREFDTGFWLATVQRL